MVFARGDLQEPAGVDFQHRGKRRNAADRDLGFARLYHRQGFGMVETGSFGDLALCLVAVLNRLAKEIGRWGSDCAHVLHPFVAGAEGSQRLDADVSKRRVGSYETPPIARL